MKAASEAGTTQCHLICGPESRLRPSRELLLPQGKAQQDVEITVFQ